MLLLVWTNYRSGLRDRVEQRIWIARASILWERIWPALWPASGIVGILVAAALFGFLGTAGAGLKVPLVLAVIGTAAYFLHKNFHDFRVPDWSDAARRLERDSLLIHRPITERSDRLAIGKGEKIAEGLWHTHMRTMLARHDRLKFVVPRASLKQRDPYGLRFAVVGLLLGGFLVAGRDWSHRLESTFSLRGQSPSVALDAWVDPPGYTGLAPIYLPRGDQTGHKLSVPSGSALTLRVHGLHVAPTLKMIPRPQNVPAFSGKDADYAAYGKLNESEQVTVSVAGQTVGSWRITAIADKSPTINFAEKPSRTERDSVKFAFRVADDYGVISARAVIRPAGEKSNQKPLIVELPLSESSAKTSRDTVYRDLTSHPYAGLDVTITLEAKDGAGNIGRSKPVRFTLPARVFTNPLARALIEQRQNLSLDGKTGSKKVASALDALTLAPEHFFDAKTGGAFIGIRAAYWALQPRRPDIGHAQDMLWQTAMGLERGGLAPAAEELRRLQQLLSQALAQGAPQAVVDALLQRYQQALNRYLQMLAQNPPKANSATPPNAKVLKPEDLQSLLNAIQQLAQTGARAQAQQLLAMLQSLLENLHMTAGPGGQGGTGSSSQNQALQGLSDLMGKQRELLDKTFREQQGNPDPKAGGPKGLSRQQGDLKQQLDQLLQGMGKNRSPGGKEPGDAAKQLDEASKQMGQAQGQLGGQALDDATQSERKALDAMREGAGKLAKQMMNQNGQEGQNAADEDPLGRAQGGNGSSLGSGVKIPDKSQMERAKNILEELRKRAEQRGRPKEELDYIDRLLKQF